MVLPTDVAPGDPGHAALHNDVNTVANALAADTGWRVVDDPDLDTNVLYRRVGALAFFTIANSDLSVVEWTLPAGWGALATDGGIALVGYSEGSAIRVFLSGHLASVDSTAVVSVCACYPTDDPWPTTLPGTPA